MAGKIALEFISRKNYLSIAPSLNVWGFLNFRSYQTTEKITEVLQRKALHKTIEAHNNQIPTYQQIKNSPELQGELAKMYESYAQDPDFHRLTIESMKMGIISLGKEEL